ncbi:MAG: hypothetical protein ACM31E_11740 [Fibrobacterota bacterium]|jgi:hypothetical protein|nr:hypothetical protein [Chitinispirillaceae bacterium]
MVQKRDMIQLKSMTTHEHAKIAFKNGFYIEGLQILHGNLEISLRILIILIRKENYADSDEIEDLLDEFNYLRCSKLLFILGYIEKDTYDKLMEFNKWKNFIINNMLLHVFKEDVPAISAEQYEKTFLLGEILNEQILHLLETTHQELDA